jgi:hypothetical protein
MRQGPTPTTTVTAPLAPRIFVTAAAASAENRVDSFANIVPTPMLWGKRHSTCVVENEGSHYITKVKHRPS